VDSVLTVNGSPRRDKGNTALVLKSVVEGLREEGCAVEGIVVDKLTIKPCSCSAMRCWYDTPGECCIRDEMDAVYPKLKSADLLVLATPVYVPLPGRMQGFLNRLCPLIEPELEFRAGRTRARMWDGVRIRRVAVVATGGWREKENCDPVVRIARELAEDMGAEFSGAVLRPHAFLMLKERELTQDGTEVLAAARQAGRELARGMISEDTLASVSRPLVTEEELRSRYNAWLRGVREKATTRD
jgi:multimeric flavodoxin WrbA